MPRKPDRQDESPRAAQVPRAFRLREAFAAISLCLVAAGPLWALDWLAERRQQVEQMTAAEKEELNEKYEKFLTLPSDQQEQLRRLHQELDIDTHGDRLRGVMHRYYDWLKTLSPGERADLLSQPPADRLVMIKKIKQHQEALSVKLPDGSHLTIPDVQVLSDWVKKYAAVHEAELVKDMLSPRHADFPGNEKAPHDRSGRFSAWRPWLGTRSPTVSNEEIDDLAQQLTAGPRKAIEGRSKLSDKTELVHEWVRAIWRQRVASGNGFGRPGSNVSKRELAKFLSDLSKEKQAELSKMPEEEQHRELRRLYFQHRRSVEPSAGTSGDADQHGNKIVPKTPEPGPTKSPESPASKTPGEKQPLPPSDPPAKAPEANDKPSPQR